MLLVSQRVGGAMLWDAIVLYETFKISWPTDEHCMRTCHCTVPWPDHTVRSRTFLETHFPEDEHRGNKMLSGIFTGYARSTGGGLSGDLLLAGWDEHERNIASEVHIKSFFSPRKSKSPQMDMLCSHVLTDPSDKKVTTLSGTDDVAGGDSDAQDQPQPRSVARGDSDADDTMPRKPQSVQRKTTVKGRFLKYISLFRLPCTSRSQEPSFPNPLKYIDVNQQTKHNFGHFGGTHHRRLLENGWHKRREATLRVKTAIMHH